MKRLIVALTLLISAPCMAGTYYVSPTGSAAWAQSASINTPCAATTAMANAVAGDTVYFRGGTYELGQSNTSGSARGVLEPVHSGTVSSRIVFTAYTGETPVLNTTTSSGALISRAWADGGQSYITLSGFTISSTGKCGSVGIGTGSTGVTIDRCNFIGATGTNTDNISGVALQTANYTTISNCTFTGYKDTADNHNTSCIKEYNTQYLTVTGCTFVDNTVAIYNKVNGSHSTYSNNFFKNNYGHIFVLCDWPPDSDYTTISNNVMVNASYAAILIDQDQVYAPNVTINNNTIYNSIASARMVSINNSTGRYVYNNIFAAVSTPSDGVVRYVAGSTVDEDDHNLYFTPSFKVTAAGVTYTSLAAYQSSTVLTGGGHPGAGSLSADPLFANVSGTLTTLADFSLVSNSPAKLAGRSGADIGAGGSAAPPTHRSLIGRLSGRIR